MTSRRTMNLSSFQVPFVTIPLWVAGIVIAKGFWSTFFAMIFPFWAWYLAVEKLLVHFGVI